MIENLVTALFGVVAATGGPLIHLMGCDHCGSFQDNLFTRDLHGQLPPLV